MSRTYKATGINLKSMAMGESDRLLTVLTREFGLLRLMALGARKHNSKLGGRSGLFVVNELLIAKGRSLDKITQAETVESYPGLGRDLKKLTAGQYLAELTLSQALDDHPQEDLFYLLNEHLARLERSPSNQVLPHLAHAIFQLLVLAGVAPQVHQCCITQTVLTPDFSDASWRIGFNASAGGTLVLAAVDQLRPKPQQKHRVHSPASHYSPTPAADLQSPSTLLTAPDLFWLQQLSQSELSFQDISLPVVVAESDWSAIERALRHYAQYHFDRPIRSAALIDSCFSSSPPELSPQP